VIPGQQLFEDDAFARAECGLSVIPEDGRNCCAPLPLDLYIRIDYRPAQALGHTPRDSRLARAAETDQDDPIDVTHNPLRLDLDVRGRPV
jgi:hypothetical protein